MNKLTVLRPWMTAAVLAVFLSACATSQDQIIDDDGAPLDGQSQAQADGVDDGITSLDGADASGVDDSGSDITTAIVDDSPKTASELLDQADGVLSNRIVYFEFDSAKLTDESIALLETHGNFVAGNGEVNVRLEGHADERGSREYNIALGDRRAQSVRRVLLFQGASVDQVDTVSYGEEKPAMSGHNDDAWNKNRRVELIYQVN
jgi:peptidoglycan-associated lipoprotein